MARKPKEGAHALPTAAFDPKTGQSLTGGDDSEEARLLRLRRQDAYDALDAGDVAGYRRIMSELAVD